MRILGVDPGLTRCGYGVIETGPGRTATLVDVGVFRSPAEDPLERRLLSIGQGILGIMDEVKPDSVALEKVFAQQNLSTVMGVAQISGIVLHGAALRGIPIALHTPTQVKAAVTGYGAADKAQVGTMVARILRLDAVPKPADAADALALAITHAWAGPAASDAPSTSNSSTPALDAWRAAEASAAKTGRGRKLSR